MRVLTVVLLLCLAALATSDPAKDRSTPLVVGHRGDPTHAPENTMSAFRSAQSVGADGFETDLWLTKDGVIVLCHDPTLDRTTNCSGKISDFMFAEIETCDAGSWYSSKFAGERIPTLQQAVEFARDSDMFIVLDLKMEGLAEKIAKVVLPLNMGSRVIASCRSDGECANDIHAFLNCTVHQRLSSPPAKWDESYFANYVLADMQGFSLSQGGLLPDFVKMAHEHLMSVFAWTVDSDADIDTANRNGLDGMISNDPERVLKDTNAIRRKLYGDWLHDAPVDMSASNEDSHRTTPLIVGHRGFPTEYPENTLPSFQGAFENGADGFETDLWLTKDGVIVLCHDPTLDRTTNCSGKISDHTYEYISHCDAGAKFSPKFAGTHVPKFEDAVKLAKQNKMFIVMDLKEEGLAEDISKIVRPLGMESRMIASCRSDKEVGDINHYLNGAMRQRLSSPPLIWDESYFSAYTSIGLGGFSLSYLVDLTSKFLSHAHEHLMSVFSWTDDAQLVMELAIRAGHDGIITNNCKLLKSTVDALRQRAWPSAA